MLFGQWSARKSLRDLVFSRFVTRLKSNSCYEVVQEAWAGGPFLAGQVIRLSSRKGQASYPEPLRRVRQRDPEIGKEHVFLTNRLDLSALEVAGRLVRAFRSVRFFLPSRWPPKR
jgi:hypothetical protein